MPPRKTITRQTRLDVLMEVAYRCGNPRCNHILTLDIHHIVWVRDGGGDDASNLLALCPNCHSLHTAGHIPAEAIRHWKGMLVALNRGFDRQAMDILLLLFKRRMLIVSGDGVLAVSGPIAAGLIEFESLAAEQDMQEAISKNLSATVQMITRYSLRLTESGRLLVDYWLQGNETEYSRMLAGADKPS